MAQRSWAVRQRPPRCRLVPAARAVQERLLLRPAALAPLIQKNLRTAVVVLAQEVERQQVEQALE